MSANDTRLTLFQRGIIAAIVLGLGHVMLTCFCLPDHPVYTTPWGKAIQGLATVMIIGNVLVYTIVLKRDLRPFHWTLPVLTALFIFWWWTIGPDWGPLDSAMRVLGVLSSAGSASVWLIILFNEQEVRGRLPRFERSVSAGSDEP